ncbi:hypothetical protein [Clostridium sp. BJN0001]|uniref:hypothetical protein n=1 Tax=Clostridium sp. BJN0001 TaxID=2930219 RepID=UPI001FD02CDF|nr:hypothetical protein [Clostridium sp. BJN0001]
MKKINMKKIKKVILIVLLILCIIIIFYEKYKTDNNNQLIEKVKIEKNIEPEITDAN